MMKIVEQYSDVFQSNFPDALPHQRTVDYEIETNPEAKITNRRLFWLSSEELRATREYIEDNLKSGRIRVSKIPCGAPLFFEKKEGKPLRGVVDYRMLNKITKKNSTPTFRSDEMFEIIGGSNFYKSWPENRLPSNQSETRTRWKNCIPNKVWTVWIFGSTDGSLQRPCCIHHYHEWGFERPHRSVLHSIPEWNIYIFERCTRTSQTCKKVLKRLWGHKLYASPEKRYFMANEVEFLEVIVCDEGLKVNPAKIEFIMKWPTHTSISEVRSFLVSLLFFWRFIKFFCTIAFPLMNLTKARKSIKDWDESCTQALERLKKSLISFPILCHPDFNLPYKCHVDASRFTVGGTLAQVFDGSERVIS